MKRLLVAFLLTAGVAQAVPHFDWAVELERGDICRGPLVTNRYESAAQHPSVVELEPGKWRIFVEQLKGPEGAVDVSVMLEVTEREGRTSVVGSVATIERNAVVTAFDGPYFAPTMVVDGRTKFLLPHCDGVRIKRFPAGTEERCGLLVRQANGRYVPDPGLNLMYPSRRMTMQWMAVSDDATTEAYFVKDPACGPKRTTFVFDPKSRELVYGFRQELALRPGDRYDLPRVERFAYAGDWHRAAEDYGRWFASAIPHAQVPDCVRDCTTLMLLICKQQNGTIVWPFGEFDKLADALEAHGITDVKILGRGPGGHDALYPDYSADPAMGGAKTLSVGLKLLRERGIKTYAYVNGQLIERGTTDYWRKGGGNRAGILQRDGSRAWEGWLKYNDQPVRMFDVACMGDRTWQGRLSEILHEAYELGFGGLYVDQVGKQWPWRCYADNHAHQPGDWVWAQDRMQVMQGLHDDIVRYDPEFALTTEGYCEAMAGSCAINLGLRDPGAIENRFEQDLAFERFPEMSFFTVPDYITSDRYAAPTRTRRSVNAAALFNYRPDLEVRYPGDRQVFERCEAPDPAEYASLVSKPLDYQTYSKRDLTAERDYLKCVNGFRRTHREQLLRGIFRDTLGFELKTDGGNVIAKRWVARDGRTSGVLVWNADAVARKVSVVCAAEPVGVFEPEKDAVDASLPLAAESLRLYVFKEK